MEKIFKYIFISIHEKKINVLYVELYIKYSTCDFLGSGLKFALIYYLQKYMSTKVEINNMC